MSQVVQVNDEQGNSSETGAQFGVTLLEPLHVAARTAVSCYRFTGCYLQQALFLEHRRCYTKCVVVTRNHSGFVVSCNVSKLVLVFHVTDRLAFL